MRGQGDGGCRPDGRRRHEEALATLSEPGKTCDSPGSCARGGTCSICDCMTRAAPARQAAHQDVQGVLRRLQQTSPSPTAAVPHKRNVVGSGFGMMGPSLKKVYVTGFCDVL